MGAWSFFEGPQRFLDLLQFKNLRFGFGGRSEDVSTVRMLIEVVPDKLDELCPLFFGQAFAHVLNEVEAFYVLRVQSQVE